MKRLERTPYWDLLDPGTDLAAYDELPLLPEDVDPQLHASYNDCIQPFYLVCEKDSVIATLAGNGVLRFHGVSVNSYPLEPGDFVYVPARVPHRIEPMEPLLQLRYKAKDPAGEAVAWFCETCDAELWRYEFDASRSLSQSEWLTAVQRFNGSADLRQCECGSEAPQSDLGQIRWGEVVDAIQGRAGV